MGYKYCDLELQEGPSITKESVSPLSNGVWNFFLRKKIKVLLLKEVPVIAALKRKKEA